MFDRENGGVVEQQRSLVLSAEEAERMREGVSSLFLTYELLTRLMSDEALPRGGLELFLAEFEKGLEEKQIDRERMITTLETVATLFLTARQEDGALDFDGALRGFHVEADAYVHPHPGKCG